MGTVKWTTSVAIMNLVAKSGVFSQKSLAKSWKKGTNNESKIVFDQQQKLS
jgi:hypothetical protein